MTSEEEDTIARAWLAGELRKLAGAIEDRRVVAFAASTPLEIVQVPPQPGDQWEKHAQTGVKGLYVTFTERADATERVEAFHALRVPDIDLLEGQE